MDPHEYGFSKAAYSVKETLELLSIGRTSLYALVKQGDLKAVKFGRKTLIYAVEIAAFLDRLKVGRS
jgi:excisionase family DNA binding protein